MLSTTIKIVDLKEKPTRLCSLPNSTLLIANSEANKLSLYSINFVLIKSIEKIKDVSFNNPTGIATDGVEKVYICDSGNNRILLSNTSLDIAKIAEGSFFNDIELNRPTDVVYQNGYIFVTDSLGARVYKFTSDIDFIEFYDLNQCPTQIAVFNNMIFVTDSESHSCYFYNSKLFPVSNHDSRTSSTNSDENGDDSDYETPCCEIYGYEGPACIVDDKFIQWNKYNKTFYFYKQNGKIESTIYLRSLVQAEMKRKQIKRVRLYRHEKFMPIKKPPTRKRPETQDKPRPPTFSKITRDNFAIGNTRKAGAKTVSTIYDDVCYFNGRIVMTYGTNKLVVI